MKNIVLVLGLVFVASSAFGKEIKGTSVRKPNQVSIDSGRFDTKDRFFNCKDVQAADKSCAAATASQIEMLEDTGSKIVKAFRSENFSYNNKPICIGSTENEKGEVIFFQGVIEKADKDLCYFTLVGSDVKKVK